MFGLISITTLLIATIAAFVAGFLWYSPALFGTRWAQLVNIKFDENASMLPCMIKGFFIALLQVVGLAWLFALTGTVTLVAALKVVGVITFVFIGAPTLNAYIWEKRSLELILINLGSTFVSLMAIAAVLIYLA